MQNYFNYAHISTHENLLENDERTNTAATTLFCIGLNIGETWLRRSIKTRCIQKTVPLELAAFQEKLHVLANKFHALIQDALSLMHSFEN